MQHYQMFIDGEWCDAQDGATLESINPATGEVWATAAVAGEAEVNRAVAAADRALKQLMNGKIKGRKFKVRKL